jgi:acyl carrier protein
MFFFRIDLGHKHGLGHYNRIKSLIKYLNLKKYNEKLKYNDIPEWDSIGHMTLMSALEEGFNISLGADDIVDFSSFKKGMQILKKYKVN